jgi:hypothetical protein
MRIRLTRAHVRGVRSTWRSKKWLRVTGYLVLCFGLYSAGHSQGERTSDPRTKGGPGNTYQLEQLEGKWDGIGSLPNGTTFCLVGFPCEDAGLDK